LEYLRPGAEWSLTNNDFDTLVWHGPGEAPTLAELETAWQQIQTHKIWPNAQAFMAAFTMPEKVAISLSTDPTTAALRLELTTWQSTVDPSHELVQTGLNKLVEIGIITESRKAEIIATASAS
jgi:hypothetical protein